MNRTLLWALLAVMAGGVLADCLWTPSRGHEGECRIPGIITDGDDDDDDDDDFLSGVILMTGETLTFTLEHNLWFGEDEDTDGLDDAFEEFGCNTPTAEAWDHLHLFMMFPDPPPDPKLEV